MSITIHEASTGDWRLIADITQVANSQYAREADPNFWTNYEHSTRQMLLSDDAVQRIIAKEGDEVVASVIYCPPYERQIAGKVVRNPFPEMRLLSVLPQHRNKGLADVLIQECERRAKAEGYSHITLHTTRLMTVAKAMYERRGYSRFDDIDFEPVKGFIVWGYIKEL